MADQDSQQIDTTLTALAAGVTPDTALGVVDQWQERLTREADPRLREIALDLATLKTAVTAERPDAITIAMIVEGLGEKTLAAAGTAGPYQAQLEQLGKALTDSSRAIRGD